MAVQSVAGWRGRARLLGSREGQGNAGVVIGAYHRRQQTQQRLFSREAVLVNSAGLGMVRGRCQAVGNAVKARSMQVMCRAPSFAKHNTGKD